MIASVLSVHLGMVHCIHQTMWVKLRGEAPLGNVSPRDVARITLGGYCFTGKIDEDEKPIIVRKSDFASFLNLIQNQRYRPCLYFPGLLRQSGLSSKIVVRLKNGETWSETFLTHLARDVYGIPANQVFHPYLRLNPLSAVPFCEAIAFSPPTLPSESLLRLNKIDQDGIVSVLIGGEARPTRYKNVLLGSNAHHAAKIGQFVSAVELSSRTSRKPIVPDSYLEFRSIAGERFRFEFSKKRIREDTGYFLESLLRE